MHLKFIFIVLTTAATLAGLWSGLFYFEFESHTESSYAQCKNVQLKRELAQQAGSPKLVVVAGSSAARGINAEILSKVTGQNVVNFGLFAGIGPELVLYEARRVLQPGDVVLLALEYNHYVSDGPTSGAVDYVLGCGRDYFLALPLSEKLQYIFGLRLSRIYESWIFNPTGIAKRGDQSNLTPRGDMKLIPEVFPPLSGPDRIRMSLYRPMPIIMNPRSHGAQTIAAFVAWAKEHNIKVIGTWPNTIDFPEYTHATGFEEIRRFYSGLDVQMVGDVSSSLLPLSMFYNTQYHLNIEGTRVRSKQLASDLLKVFAPADGPD